MPGEFWISLGVAISVIFGISITVATVISVIKGVPVILGMRYGLLLAIGVTGLLLLLRGSSERNNDRGRGSIVVYSTKDAVERVKRNLGGEKRKNV